MSRLVVRQAMETELNAFLNAQVPVVPFYDTINMSQSPKDELWVTVSYFADYIEDMCYGGSKRVEHGTIDVEVYGRSGKSYTPVITLATSIEEHFLDNARHLNNGLDIINSLGVDDSTAGDGAPWYGASVSFEYKCYL